MQTLLSNMRYLCDEARMLTGISVAYGTPDACECAEFGRAQETENGAPAVRPFEADSLCDLASLTKLFTCVAALTLVERGKLSLSESVGQIDPRFVNLRDAAVGDVLAFKVSLKTPGRIDEAPNRSEGLRRLFAVEHCPTPAVRVYSDINAMVIKYVIEAKADMPFFEALSSLILRPAGMRETFAAVPKNLRGRCVRYSGEHRIEGERWFVRNDPPLGLPHDPKALLLCDGGRDLCGHAGLFSTRADMVRFAQALLLGELLSFETLGEIGRDRTGRDNGDGTRRQSLGYLCFSKHPDQRLSEVPAWMSNASIGLSGFTGNHLAIDPIRRRFVLFLGNRCHDRVSHIAPPPGKNLTDYGLDARGVGLVRWTDGRLVPSSAQYVYFKDERLHEPIAMRMRALGWLS